MDPYGYKQIVLTPPPVELWKRYHIAYYVIEEMKRRLLIWVEGDPLGNDKEYLSFTYTQIAEFLKHQYPQITGKKVQVLWKSLKTRFEKHLQQYERNMEITWPLFHEMMFFMDDNQRNRLLYGHFF